MQPLTPPEVAIYERMDDQQEDRKSADMRTGPSLLNQPLQVLS